MKNILLTISTLTLLMLFTACASKNGRGIELKSPCACYEIEKITQNKG
ncbi:hypothetical protein [Campylobacter helveticus]|nr:hypothetical protein [Campylobacter helveticus]MCR2062506.1 hypothetical protein [Campylobacter helveticus]MCR2066552.1 hypothetical protein [Campylobacter helveticus]